MHLGQGYIAAGAPDSAARVLERGLAVIGYRPPFMLGHLAIAYFQTNREEQGNAILDELKIRRERTGPSGSPAFCIGMVYSARGDIERAIEWLEKSYAAHEVEMIWLKMEPTLKPLHGDPRYENLLRRVGFPEEVKG